MTDNQFDSSIFITKTKRDIKSGNNIAKHFLNARDALRRRVDVAVDQHAKTGHTVPEVAYE